MWWSLAVFVISTGALMLFNHFNRQRRIIGRKRTMFVTAHPDDESMFFAPTIMTITSYSPETVFLLCLSQGDYYGQGDLRKQELLVATSRLGIPSGNVFLVHDKELPDDPNKHWSASHVMTQIKKYVQKADIGRVVTFDGIGVSGHLNHIAISMAARRLSSEATCSGLELWLLETSKIGRKYMGWLDLPLSLLCHGQYVVIHVGPYGWITALYALTGHHSQMVWYRILYMLFSRYMIVNSYTALLLYHIPKRQHNDNHRPQSDTNR